MPQKVNTVYLNNYRPAFLCANTCIINIASMPHVCEPGQSVSMRLSVCDCVGGYILKSQRVRFVASGGNKAYCKQC